MPISHDLSGEIATALFAAKERSPHELNDLKQMVLDIHSTLEGLQQAERVDHDQANAEPKSLLLTNG